GDAELLQAVHGGRLVLRQQLGDAPPQPRLLRVVVDEGERGVVLELAERLGELLLARRLLDAALAREERVEGVARGETPGLARRRLAHPALLRPAVGARLARRRESEAGRRDRRRELARLLEAARREVGAALLQLEPAERLGDRGADALLAGREGQRARAL